MAKPVVVTIPHTLGKAEARRRIEAGFGQLRGQLAGGLSTMLTFADRWEGDRLVFDGSGLGQKVSGRVDVHETTVVIEIDLPEILAALAGNVMSRLQREGARLLLPRT